MNWITTLFALCKRELQLFASGKTFLMLSIGLPLTAFLLFVVIFREGVPRELPVAVLDQDNSPLSRKLTRMIDATPTAHVAFNLTDMIEGERMMKMGEIDAIITLPEGMERDIYRTDQVNVTAYINGLNLTKNGLLNKDIQTTVTTFSSGIQIQTLMKKGLSEKEAYDQMMPIYFEKHVLFNPYINYTYYLLPSFLPLMLMMFILLTTVFSLGVELKNGTAGEWLAAANGNTLLAITGKLLPYTVIFFTLYIAMNTVLYKFIGVPLQGSAAFLFGSGLLFVLASQAVGLFLITLLSNMRLALSIGGGYSVLAFTFSGLTFPFMAMDGYMQAVSYIFPFTYYIEIFIDQAMRGAPVLYSLPYAGYMSLFLLLPLLTLRRLKTICTHPIYWGRL